MVMPVTNSVQDRARANGRNTAGGPVIPMPVLLFGPESPGSEIPRWWSRERDRELRRFAKTEGLLASSIYTMQAIVASTGFNIDGKPRTVQSARVPIDDAEYGAGFAVLLKKGCDDWLTQDNGVFFEIEGPGSISSPLLVPPIRINYMDAGRCWRSGDPEYPVWYYSSVDMAYHKIHWTRVAFSAPNPSGDELARGIGFCATSRMEAMSSVMKSIIRYKQEKTGGRHTRGILFGNVPPEVVNSAFDAAAEVADNRGEIRFSSYPYVGSPMSGDVNLDVLELSSLPDGFEWESELTLYMYCMALALGVDARELWPATSSGATRADAEVQHRKAMRKGVGDFLATMQNIINDRILPEGVTLAFKPKDNEEDQEQATIEKTRVETVKALVDANLVTVKGGTLYLVNAGVLPKEYMENPELSDAAKTEEELEAERPDMDGGPEPGTDDETPDEDSPGGEPNTEDEDDLTKQATSNETVIVDPAKVGPLANEEDLPTPSVSKDIIRRELELWRNTPELRPYLADVEEVGDYDKLPDAEGQPEKNRKPKSLWALLYGYKQANIPEAAREALLNVRIGLYQQTAEALARRLASGEITLASWEAQMREAISGMHVSAAAIGRGGWGEMTFSDWGRVGQEVRKQFSFLRAWSTDIDNSIRQGLPISEQALFYRAQLYGNSASATYSRMLQIDKGIDPAIMPAQPGDGTTECYTNCKCSWQFVPVNVGRGDWDAYWRLGQADHCPTCVSRAAQWSPLRIRGGDVVPGQTNGGLFR